MAYQAGVKPWRSETAQVAQQLGVLDAGAALVDLLEERGGAGVFVERGIDAWVFRGDDGLDELTTTATSSLWAVRGGEVTTHTIDPTRLGIARASTDDLRGGDVAFNADVVRRVLAGETGPVRDAVVLNAGAALAVYDDAEGAVEDRLVAGVERAAAAIDSGAAVGALERWVAGSAG